MRAQVGDRLVVRGTRPGVPRRDGEVIEVRGWAGSPPYLVRWSDDGHVGLYFPAADAFIAPVDFPAPPGRRAGRELSKLAPD
jgi:hypothetical protein